MRKWLLGLVVSMMAILVLAACSDAEGETTESKGDSGDAGGSTEEYEATTIRLAYNLPQDHHISVGIEQFAEDIKEKSGGKVDMQVYPAGQLLSDKDMNQSILTGGVEMGVNSSTLWASTVPAMGIFDVPYIFNDYSAVGKAVNGEFGDKLRGAMEEKGAKVLLFADYGYVQFANNKRQLKSPEDFKGLKIRSIGDLPSELIQAYGASPVFMGGGEVYMALQRDTVDGATSGTTAMLQRKYDEVTKYLTINNYAYLEFLLAVNKDFWDGLPEKTQALIEETAKETEEWIREQAEKEDSESAKALEENGMDVYVVPEEDLPEWVEAAAPVREAYLKTAGDLGQELLDIIDNE
ncbi:DctP family TRAP transporter solute-binding subunit [Sporosarcina pasteurii]|uniref:C4-dicarboxylate-binding periplasmic protein n=1 Tax=Sporosarcina pasteurii TaxID=1474 RepID=A0A380BD22_SPOPA|nr:DctP family TRAP transporter solute-binding subunit [Sporosarcina pasteurii]MDS9472553.1 DctP family TRAP transporter solute-binding subunit [Sporosarcina pasteurii]QBQ06106.1 DctP family TRAP transporter solute-binding subunit [Sporosarcina pasteurii]SUI99420.1 C4-dicarboxylate-binding periplasmic protein precursor [Sporosarcina pasteurii]